MKATVIGTVRLIYRPVVKSMRGEMLDVCQFTSAGMVGDRTWLVVNNQNQQVVTAKQKEGERLLSCYSKRAGGEDFIGIPGDPEWRRPGAWKTDRLLSEYLGMEVRMVHAGRSAQEWPTNHGFKLRAGVGYDSSPVHAVTVPAFRRAGVEVSEGVLRCRPTCVFDTGDQGDPYFEDGLELHQLLIGGSVRLAFRKQTVRCALPGRANGDLPKAPELLQAMRRVPPGADKSDMYLGGYYAVVDPGEVHVGDEVSLLFR